MQTPSLVISHLHIPIVRLQQQTIMPFIIMQQLHMLPASMRQRLCTISQAVLSSHTQVIFMPPWHFSIFMVQRGTIRQLAVEGCPLIVPGIPVIGIVPDMPIAIGFIIVLTMLATPQGMTSTAAGCHPRHSPTVPVSA
jgi:hypothetical protein